MMAVSSLIVAGLDVAGLGQVVIGVDVAVSARVLFVAVLPATLESCPGSRMAASEQAAKATAANM